MKNQKANALFVKNQQKLLFILEGVIDGVFGLN